MTYSAHQTVPFLSGNRHVNLFVAGLLLLLLSIPVHSRMNSEDLKAIYETGLIPLTEDQDGIYKSGRDYLIFETMRVKRGDTVTFTPGARLFFHSNAKITVHGVLKFDGTPDEPITIGRLNVTIPKLSKKVVMQFDSTSFYVYRTASLILNNVKLADSSISFRCTDSTSNIFFDSVTCAGNRLTFPDTVLYLWPGSCITCEKNDGVLSKKCVPPPPSPPDSQKVIINTEHFWSDIRPAVQIGLGIGIFSAAAAWYYHNDKADAAYKKYHELEAGGSFETEKRRSRIAIRNRNLAAIAAACGAASLTVTFVIGGKNK